MTFDEWWKAGTSTKVPLYGEANAKKAWDYQQARIKELEKQLQKEKERPDYSYEAQEQLTALREAVSGMNPNNPFSVIEVQVMVEENNE
jgi:hypothetical protein